MRLKMLVPLLLAVATMLPGLNIAAIASDGQTRDSAAFQTSGPIPVCPGAPAAHLIIGEFARVTPGTPDNVRSKPTKTGEQATQIAPGEEVLITGIPTCADNYLWWPVYTTNSFEGWVAEGNTGTYFLDPETSPQTHYSISTSDDTQLAYDKFSLTYPSTLARQISTHVVATTVMAFDSSGALTNQPDHIEFQFSALTPKNRFNYGKLSIYRVDTISKSGGSQAQMIGILRSLLNASAPIPQTTPIQVFPFGESRQEFHARTGYLKFKGGSGIRFVSYYDQAISAIGGDRLLYTFSGLTDDSQYYLIAVIPVSTVALQGNDKAMPNPSDPNIATLFASYVDQTVMKLEQANVSDFAPNLTDLDGLMQSIAVR